MSLENDLEAKGWIKDSLGWCHPTRGRVAGHRDEGKSAEPERAVRDALASAPQTQVSHPGKFVIRVTSFRCTLLDEDNLVEKFHVDALRYSGLLPSDAPGQATIQVTQVKVATEEEEHTRIVITPICG